jgi:DUF1365 family protein
MTIKSMFFKGSVVHARAHPVKHSFCYSIAWYAFDLDEVALLNATVPWLGHNRRAVVSLWDTDYLTKGDEPIREKQKN